MIRSLDLDMNVPRSFLPAWFVVPGLVRRGSLLHMYSTYTGPGNRFADCSSSMFLIATQSHCAEPAMMGVVVIYAVTPDGQEAGPGKKRGCRHRCQLLEHPQLGLRCS